MPFSAYDLLRVICIALLVIAGVVLLVPDNVVVLVGIGFIISWYISSLEK